MMQAKVFCLAAAAVSAWTLTAAQLIDTPINLLKEREFKPIYMHGMVTAARGWGMSDSARDYSMRRKRTYVSGEDCFTLSYKDGVFSIVFKKPLPDIYKNRSITLRSRRSSLYPPADRYVSRGKIKFKNGKFQLRPGRRFKPSDEWQEYHFEMKNGGSSVILSPEEGAEYHFQYMEEYAVYPEIGGTIALPDGGKLEKILIPENATYEMRYGLALWRGWLWRLTGVALPIVTVKEVTGPVKGALAAFKGPEKDGNWTLKVNKEGIAVSCYGDIEISNALFDYLRRGLGCAFYQNDCQKIPEMGSVKVLTAIDFTTELMYAHYTAYHRIGTMQGCDDVDLLRTRNDVDYYHLSYPTVDHVFNILVPQERYFKTNPEFFAKTGPGSYNVSPIPHFTNHCLTNPGLRKLVIRNAVKFAREQYGPRRLVISDGDSPIHCLCDNCVKFNKGRESYSNATYSFLNEMAEQIGRECPDLRIERGAYASRASMPDSVKRVTDNSVLVYAMGGFRCKLHVDCELNRNAFDAIKNLLTLVDNDPGRFSFMHYSDFRPLYMVKLMKELNKYGRDTFFLWYYRSYHPSMPFLLGRYNLGEDPEKLLKEFEEAYYGEGAPHVHRAFEIAEEFAVNYKHTPGEIKGGTTCSIWPDSFGGSNTVLDRKTLDRIYSCFHKAIRAVGKDKVYRKHIYRDLLFYLVEDLYKYRAANCRTDAEFNAYVKRLAWLIRIGRAFPGEFKNLMLRTDARTYLSGVTGITIPVTKRHWAQEPILRKIIAEPGKYLTRNGENFLGQGLYFKPLFFTSNFQNTVDVPPEVKVSAYQRDNMVLYPTQTMELTLPVKKLSNRPMALSIEAVKETKGGTYSIEVAVNGRNIYRGPAAYAADKWGRMGFSIPAEALKAGDNKVTVKNTSVDGWIAVSEIYTIDIFGDFQNFIAGKDSLWRINRSGPDPKGSVTGGGGKAVLEVPSGHNVSLSFFNNRHNYPKIAVTPGGRVKMRVTASGSGNIRLCISRYTPYQLDKNGDQKVKPNGYTQHIGNIGRVNSKLFTLGDKPAVFEAELAVSKRAGLVLPTIVLEGGGRAEITDFSLTVSQPEL